LIVQDRSCKTVCVNYPSDPRIAEPNEVPAQLIPEGVEPKPEHVDFAPLRLRDPRFVAREGRYTNDRQQTFILTAAAPRDDEARLDRYLAQLTVWSFAWADPDLTGPEPERDVEHRLLDALDRFDDEVRGARIALDTRLGWAPEFETGASISYVFRIDPIIRADDGQAYSGPNTVIVWINDGNSQVRLAGLTNEPTVVQVGDAARRLADHHCTIRGIAARSDYGIDGRAGDPNWVPVG